MGIIAVISNTQTSFPVEIISQGGTLSTISLIVTLSIAFLISDSKYSNEWTSDMLRACTNPFLITFAAIVAFKIFLII